MDGIIIDQVSNNASFDINAVGAEYSSIIKNAIRASSSFGLGGTTEILINHRQSHHDHDDGWPELFRYPSHQPGWKFGTRAVGT